MHILIGGIGLLLYGIRLLAAALTDLAGRKAEKYLAALDRRLLTAFAAGLLVTAVLQSSSATTVMIACLAHSRIIPLATASAAIMGANVGTAVTPHLLALSPGTAAGWLVGAGVFTLLAFENAAHWTNAAARSLLGLGLLFWGLLTIETTMGPLVNDPRATAALLSIQGRPGPGAFAGFLLATLLDSSSVAVALLGRVLRQDLLALEDAVPVLFGINIGTTTATMLAAAALGPRGRQAALVHVLFNVIGALLLWPFRDIAANLARLTALDPAHQLANSHWMFNAVNAAIQLPLLRVHLAAARRFFPDRPA